MLMAMDNSFTLPVRGYGDAPDTVTQLSERDAAYFSEWEWRLHNGYAARFLSAEDGTPRKEPVCIFLHRAILQAPPGRLVVDHRNGDRLDNRRENLRLVTRAINNCNKKSKGQQGFIGITRDRSRSRKPYVAQIASGGTGRTIGRYETPEEAAWAYDTVARQVHGEGCRLNFPDRPAMPGVKIPDFKTTKGRKYVPYPGVTFDKRPNLKKPWMAFFYDKQEKKTKHLGMFATPEEAAAVARKFRDA
jgi:hypothetical protein